MSVLTSVLAAIDTKLQTDLGLQAAAPAVLFALFILAILALAFLGWIVIIVAAVKGYALPIRRESHAPPPWGAIDIIVIGVAWVAIHLLGRKIMQNQGLLKQPLDPNLSLMDMGLLQFLSLLGVVAGVLWLLAWFRSSSQYSGWSPRFLVYDFAFGAVVFILSAPFLWALMAAATLVTQVEYDHPLIVAVEDDPSKLYIAFWVAVVVAPIFEEFTFRVLLQGYLQSLADKSSVSKIFIAIVGRGRTGLLESPASTKGLRGQLYEDASKANEATISTNRPQIPSISGKTVVNPYTAVELPTETPPSPGQVNGRVTIAKIWPIFVSGVIFGLMHFDYGVSWIPLVFFGMVLGWLYQRTNRIWPSLLAHAFCNLIGVTGITLQVLYGTLACS